MFRRKTKSGRDRSLSSSSGDKPNRRHRSVSATFSSMAALPSHDEYHTHQLHLLYLGFVTVDEPRSTKDISATVRNVMATTHLQKNVTVTYDKGVLTVAEETGDRLILCHFQDVAIVTQDTSRNSYTDGSNRCIVLGFQSGRYAKQSHVFQASTDDEASNIVQVLQKALKANKGMTKHRKGSESSSAPKPRGAEFQVMNSRLNAMEDEDELIEHKPIDLGARRDSKRTVPSLARVSSEGLPSSLPSPLTDLPQQLGQQSKKKSQRKSTSQRVVEDTEFTDDLKKDQLRKAVDKIAENNDLLRDKCRALLTANSSFEEALIAVKTGNCELLGQYLSSGRISADSADVNRNSLLHYAVAMGNVDIIRVMCNSCANLESPGWNDCRPLHRAVAEGNKSVVQLLIQNGAQVNGLDIMRRTPLHISSGKPELNECSIALVEQGAQIMATDLLTLRPCDLNPELKEIQNRLVTAACESFVSAKLKDVTPNPSAGSSATPHSLSPASTRPSSTTSGKLSRDLDDLVDHISLRARIVAQAHRNKLTSQPISRSYNDLLDLRGDSADAAYQQERLHHCKFSSECRLDSVYPELEGSAHQVVAKINALIKETKKFRKPVFTTGEGRGEEAEDQWEELDVDMSLSEPNLITEDNREYFNVNGDKKLVSPMRRPFSSAAVLQSHAHPLSKVRNTSRTDNSSTGTLIEDDSESDRPLSIQEVGETFEFGEGGGDSELKDNDDLTDTLRRRPRPVSSTLSEGSPGRITRKETNSIFDELILQMNEVSEVLDTPLSPSSGQRSSDQRSSSAEVNEPSSPEKVVTSPDTTDSRDTAEKINNRPISTLSEQTDMYSSLPRPKEGRKAATRTVSLSSATLPKKVKGRWLHRVGSPLLKSRKSFKSSSSSKRRNSRDESVIKEERAGEVKGEVSAGNKVESKKKGSRRLFARKRSLPDVHNYSTVSSPATTPTFQSTTPTFPRVSSSDNFPLRGESSMTSLENRSNRLPKQSPLLSPPMPHLPPSRPCSCQGDPVTNSLDQMVTLSRNKECLSTLVSYICMPKCDSRLRQLSQDSQTTVDVLKNIATLMTNIFEAGGTTEGRKNALKSGVLDLTIKLLQGRDPIPGTCLSLINSLLVSEDDSDFLRIIVRIPSKPLLQYLEPAGDVVSESDSGYGNLRRDALLTCTARSSSDVSNHVTQDEGVAGMGSSTLEVPPPSVRASSINSEISESSYSGRSLASPTLQGNSVTNLEARRIVLKMLAVSSTHSKMQNELSNERALSLLSDVFNDPSHENLTNVLITLANVAQNVSSHELFFKLGLVEKFYSSLVHGPHPRYHASRALVYLGKLEMLKGISLFTPMATGYETDVLIQTTDSNGHTYARGATIEKCVEMLTDKLSLLWGGFSLTVGPLSPSTDSITNKASKEQIVNFFLMMYKSFVHPLIFVRLLRHRLAYPDPENVFDWSVELKSNSPEIKATPMPVIPPEQLNVFKLIGRWMESYPEDFVKYPLLQTEVDHVISRLRPVRGAYLPHTHRLKSLLQDVHRPQSDNAVVDITEKREPHHEYLYKLCKQMVIGGHLPVTSDEAVYLASLNMHIEELSTNCFDPNSSGSFTKGGRKATSRIKSVFPPGYTKSKNLLKRIQSQIKEFDKLSDRNSKHRYIERCQGNPGYDCTFFSVRVPSGGRFKKGGVSKQLLGIGSKKVVFLHEKTKEVLLTHPLTSVLNVTRESDSSTLVFSFRGDMTEFKVQVDSPSHALDMVNVLEQCKGDRMSAEESLAVRWSESQSSLLAFSVEDRLTRPDSPSDESSNEKTDERGATPPGPLLSNDILKGSLDQDYSHLEPVPSNGILDSTLTRKTDTLGKESTDNLSLTEDRAVFCDCPPDPELPLTFNLQHILLAELLASPLEVARQMTLIAHERFGAITPVDLLEKVNVIPKRSSKVVQRDSRVSNHSSQSLSLSFSDMEQQETSIEKLAYRFNQVGNWVASCILQFDTVEERSEAIEQFITIAQHCYELRNYSSIMAIVVAGLGSAPIRRLHQSWAAVQKERKDLFKEIDLLLDSKGNYKKYRQSLAVATTPCVPYVGVFLKDLTFICDGNPDYLRGGLINLHKRRQVYQQLQEVHHFQQDHYKLHRVPELTRYLLSHQLVPEDDLHSLSQTLEPRIKRSQSQTNTRLSSTASHKGSFFKSISRSSISASNLNKV